MAQPPTNNDGRAPVVRVIVGPTAGGKSARALDLAKQVNGVIINADSMQIYDGLPILTAQPPKQDTANIPHCLYACLDPDDPCSAGKWRDMATLEIENAFAVGRTPIIVGGTGLYIKALIEGLSPLPAVPDAIRAAATEKQKALGNPAFHAELQKRDPVMAARLHPNDTARLIRAYEMFEATGQSLAHWQAQSPTAPPAHWHFDIQRVMPERDELHRRCDARFLTMLDSGALEEAEDFSDKIDRGEISESAALTKALGFRPLRDYLKGALSKSAAIEKSQAETRQYAKRQATWFRHQL